MLYYVECFSKTIFLCIFLTPFQYDISFRDLSFNNLSGTIPRTYADMKSVKYMYEIHHIFLGQFILGVNIKLCIIIINILIFLYGRFLTGNLLTGSVPAWKKNVSVWVIFLILLVLKHRHL